MARGKPEQTTSLWMAVEVAKDAGSLKGDHRCDTAIVGAGIAGLSTAYELTEAGHRVIVVDRGTIAGGVTARTTAHLAPICDDGVASLIKLRGVETARLFQTSHEAAVNRIEELVRMHDIACNFRRLDAFLFPAPGMTFAEARKQMRAELSALNKASAEAEWTKGVPLKGFEDAPALRYPNQATFHPLRYLKGLCDAIEEKGGKLFANSAVNKVEELEGSVRITTDAGIVAATHAVFATNSPIIDRVTLHSKMAPYRTYAMAFTLPRELCRTPSTGTPPIPIITSVSIQDLASLIT